MFSGAQGSPGGFGARLSGDELLIIGHWEPAKVEVYRPDGRLALTSEVKVSGNAQVRFGLKGVVLLKVWLKNKLLKGVL